MQAKKIKTFINDVKAKQKSLATEHADFLIRFNALYKLVEAYKITNDKQRFSNLLSGIGTIKLIFEKISENFAYGYNIFSIIRNIERKEEITHTPVLANLLNVKGTHSQKKLFYTNFIAQLFKGEKENIKYFTNIDKDYFFVSAEKSTVFGRLDILIEHYGKTNPFTICIENKIDAGDQPEQLQRYYKYLQTKKTTNSKILLIYLTKNKKKPSPNSIRKNEYENLIKDNELKLMSYRKDINKILGKSIPAIKAENVKQTVIQYHKIIKTF